MKRSELWVIQKPAIAIAAILFTFTSCTNADFVFGTVTNLGPTINNSYDVMGVCISRDGLELYFSSNQAGGYGGYDLMVATRESTEHNWTHPVNLGQPANTRYDAWTPSISRDGLTLYFSDPHYPPFGNSHPGGLGGRGDIWMVMRATPEDPWGARVNLGSAINRQHAMGPHISADDLSIYFSSHRPGSSGQCDIMVATRRTSSESFGTPTFLSQINSNGNDWAPEISTDGLKLFYMSNMDNPYSTNLNSLQLWMASRMSVSEPFQTPVKLSPPINMGSYGTFWPSLTPDCSVLYFVSDRPGGFGGYDIWQAPIIPIVDFNGDDIVDATDMCIMVDHWGEDYSLCDIGPMPWGDGIVDVQDLIVLAGHLFEESGLVAHWKLDETDGDMAYDSAGVYDGVLNGVPVWQPVKGIVDGALAFNGVDNYISTDFVLNPAEGPFSVFAWIKGEGPGQTVLSQTSGFNWLMVDAKGNLMTELTGSGRSGGPLLSQSVITDGIWHRIGFVWDGSQRTLYIDEVEAAKDTQDSLGNSSGGMYIGVGKNLEPGSFWSGLIDDVRIYKTALNTEDIERLAR